MVDYKATKRGSVLGNLKPEKIGARVRQSREAASLTQQQLAELLNLRDKSSLCRIESGQQLPTCPELVLLAGIFKTTAGWLLTGKNNGEVVFRMTNIKPTKIDFLLFISGKFYFLNE